MVNIKGLKQLA